MSGLFLVTTLILLAAFAIQTAARLGVAKTLRFGSPRHARLPEPPPELGRHVADLEGRARELGLEPAGLFVVDDGDGRPTFAVYAADSDRRVWARLEPTSSVQLPTRISLLSARADGGLAVTVYPHPDPLLPTPPRHRAPDTYFATAEDALRAHRERLDDETEPLELDALLARIDDARRDALQSWTERGWLRDGRLTLAGVFRAGGALQRYAGAVVTLEATVPQRSGDGGAEGEEDAGGTTEEE